ncbi:recombinase family protein [Tolypothrix sp. VBCCA 56010]|uniref:recombinase family protein n=1 Tax=Tolypothrix sp. VBCCA 56010 TaxID=3137731 RepID=UPI003D7D82E6
MTCPVKIALYARISTVDQNPESQLSTLRHYAQQRNFLIYREYIHHISGDTTSKSRQTRKRDIANALTAFPIPLLFRPRLLEDKRLNRGNLLGFLFSKQ